MKEEKGRQARKREEKETGREGSELQEEEQEGSRPGPAGLGRRRHTSPGRGSGQVAGQAAATSSTSSSALLRRNPSRQGLDTLLR